MKSHLPLLLLWACGCSPYIASQAQLIEQVQRGVEQLEGSLEQRAQIVDAYHRMQRARLDEAFDQDVRQRHALEADWVIEHRRAYAAAIDLLSEARVASARSSESDQRTIVALREALDRLQWLLSMQRRLTSTLPGESR